MPTPKGQVLLVELPGRGKEKNVGWRLDYMLVSERALPSITLLKSTTTSTAATTVRVFGVADVN